MCTGKGCHFGGRPWVPKAYPQMKLDTVKAVTLFSIMSDVSQTCESQNRFSCTRTREVMQVAVTLLPRCCITLCSQRMCNGYLYGFRARLDEDLQCKFMTATEDRERSVRYFAKDGIVLRYQMYPLCEQGRETSTMAHASNRRPK